MYNSGWDQYHSREESVSHLEVFLLISADGTNDSGTQADATDGQQDAESSDGTEGTSDGEGTNDGDTAADQDQEQTDDENTTGDESSDDDDDDEEEEKEEDKKTNPILGINISSDFVPYGTHRFLRFPMAIVTVV